MRLTERRRWYRAAGVALAIVTVACSSAPSQTPSPSASSASAASASAEASASSVPSLPEPTAQPTAEPTPTPPISTDARFSILPADAPPGFRGRITCTGPIGPTDPVAIVELGPRPGRIEATVLRDYSDPANPRTACVLAEGDRYSEVQQLIDARHLVIQRCGNYGCRLAMVDLPEVRYHWFELPKEPDGYSQLVAVSPGLDEVAWISQEPDGTGRKLHLTNEDGDHVVSALRPVGGRCGTPDDSKHGAYTRSGEHLYVLDVPIADETVFLVFAGTRKLLGVRPPYGDYQRARYPAMPVWSPVEETLYFRRAGHVWTWTPEAGVHRFLEGVSWRYPTISQDGRYLAYSVPRNDGFHNTFLMDLSAGTPPELIGRERTTPAFITPTQLWLVAEGQGLCGPGLDERLIYDINERAESSSIIQWVRGIWPATSSNF